MASTLRHDYTPATFAHASEVRPSAWTLDGIATMLLGPILRPILRFIMWCVEG